MPPDFHNEWLKEELYKVASRPGLWLGCDFSGPPLSRWEKFKMWLDRWMPRVHLGPCNHDECW